MGVMILVALAFLAALGGIELLARRLRVAAEDSRRAVHLSCGLGIALLPSILPMRSIAMLGALFAVLMVLSRGSGLLRSVHSVERATLGEAYMPLSTALLALTNPSPWLFSYAIVVLAVCDVAAATCGRRFTSPRLGLPGPKTVAGALAFFVSAVVVSLLFAGHLTLAMPGILLVPAVAAAVEAAAPRGLDNLVLPPLVAVLAALA